MKELKVWVAATPYSGQQVTGLGVQLTDHDGPVMLHGDPTVRVSGGLSGRVAEASLGLISISGVIPAEPFEVRIQWVKQVGT